MNIVEKKVVEPKKKQSLGLDLAPALTLWAWTVLSWYEWRAMCTKIQQQPDNTKTLFINIKLTKAAAGGECAEHKGKTGAEGNQKSQWSSVYAEASNYKQQKKKLW